MGQISAALERHDKENTAKLEDLKQEVPKRLVVEKPEVHVFEEPVLKREVRGKLVTLTDPDSADAESFKVLRGQILFPRGRQVPKLILVTSALPGEGKTYVAANLALTLALSIDEYVVAIDSDLRRPRMHLVFGHRNVRGLHDYLVGGGRLDDLILESGIEKTVPPARRESRKERHGTPVLQHDGQIPQGREGYIQGSVCGHRLSTLSHYSGNQIPSPAR
jgi:protein-tyrosine kinase